MSASTLVHNGSSGLTEVTDDETSNRPQDDRLLTLEVCRRDVFLRIGRSELYIRWQHRRIWSARREAGSLEVLMGRLWITASWGAVIVRAQVPA